MPDLLFVQYAVSPLVILSISHGDWGDSSCLGRGGYLGIERAGVEEGAEMGDGVSG
jgi:hypothetical protein